METYLVHHGIMGQRWGVRRFQNEDGSLTNRGKRKEALNQYATDQGYKQTKFGKVKVVRPGSSEHVDLMKAKLTLRKTRHTVKNFETIRKNQLAEKRAKAAETPKTKMSRKKKGAIAVSVVGGLLAADYVSAKANGTWSTPKVIKESIKFNREVSALFGV